MDQIVVNSLLLIPITECVFFNVLYVSLKKLASHSVGDPCSPLCISFWRAMAPHAGVAAPVESEPIALL